MKLEQWQNIFHVIVNANVIVQLAIQIKNGITKLANKNVKMYCWYFSDRVWWSYKCFGYCINKKGKYYSNKKNKYIATNVTSTASINCHCKKVKHCYILHTALLAIILLLTITIIRYHYDKQKCINTLAM